MHFDQHRRCGLRGVWPSFVKIFLIKVADIGTLVAVSIAIVIAIISGDALVRGLVLGFGIVLDLVFDLVFFFIITVGIIGRDDTFLVLPICRP